MDTLIEAFAALPAALEAELVVAGGPSPDDLSRDSDIERLKHVVLQYGITDRVTFLGRVPHPDVPALLRSADVFVCTPHYEPFGTAALEAASCGVPVIASSVGGLPSHVIDGTTGLLVPANSPPALTSALFELLTTPPRRKALGKAGADRSDRYAWPRIAHELVAVYRSLRP